MRANAEWCSMEGLTGGGGQRGKPTDNRETEI